MSPAGRETLFDSAVLSSDELGHLNPEAVPGLLLNVLSNRAEIRGGGKILRCAEFNVRPDINFNMALGRGLAQMVIRLVPELTKGARVELLVTETSASYLGFAVGWQLQQLSGMDGLSINRVRKLPKGERPSVVCVGERIVTREVSPITGNKTVLYAEAPEVRDAEREVDVVVGIDDVIGTEATMEGVFDIGDEIFPRAQRRLGLAVFSKAQQASLGIGDVHSLLPIEHFGLTRDGPVLVAQGFDPVPLRNARPEDFEVE